MKKGIKSLMLIAAAAMTFASCQKEDKAQVNNGEGTVKVNFTSVADGTKTYFGDRITDKYPTLWEGTEQVGITYLDANIDKENNVVGVKGEGETTTFSTELAAPSSKEGSILVFSPWYSGNYTDEDAGGFTNYVSQYTDANVVIPKKQFSTPNSCDPRAQLLVAKCNFDNGVASNVDVNFKHVTAYGKIAIKGVDAKIKTVEIDFGQNVTGTGFYYYTAGDNEGKIIENPRATNYNKSSVVIDNSNNKCDKTFWFGIPATDCSENKVVVTVTADNGKTYKKEIQGQSSNGKSLKFDPGVVTSFTVNVEEYTAPVVDVVATLTFPDENKDNNGLKSDQYIAEWTAKIGSFEWSLVACNNNDWGNDWKYVRCGRKNNTSIATITTKTAINDAVKAVNVTINTYNTSNGTATTYLQVAPTKDELETANKIEVTMAKGVLTYNIAEPQPNMFYRITFDCASGKKNGFIEISKVEYVK